MAGITVWERFDESVVPIGVEIFICDGKNVAIAKFMGIVNTVRQWEDYKLLSEKDLKGVKYWMTKEHFIKVMLKARI